MRNAKGFKPEIVAGLDGIGSGNPLVEMNNLDVKEGETLIGYINEKGWEFPIVFPFFYPKRFMCSDGYMRAFTGLKHGQNEPELEETGHRAWTRLGKNGKPEVLVLSAWVHNLDKGLVNQKWLAVRYDPDGWDPDYQWFDLY